MKLLSLTLENFKGTRFASFNFLGTDTDIYGENGAGKTTIADAYAWLLFGKDSKGRAKFQLKTTDANNEELHNLEHSVTAEFDMNGKRMSLKRTLREVWETKRGARVAEFNGHETKYWVNEVPVSAGDYESHIRGIIEESKFRLLSDPFYFCDTLEWKTRRALLIETVGDISNAALIESDPKFAPLAKLLEDRTTEQALAVEHEAKKKLAAEVKEFPIRISELSNQVAEVGDPVSTEALRAEVDALLERKAGVVAGGATAELRTKLMELKTEEQRLRLEARTKAHADTAEITEAAQQATANAKAIAAEIERLEMQRGMDLKAAEGVELRMVPLRDQKALEEAKVWTGATECTACRRPLPEEQIEEAKANFNHAKAERIKAIREEGISLKEQKEKLLAKAAEKAAEIERLKTDHEAALVKANHLSTTVADLQQAEASKGDSLDITANLTDQRAIETQLEKVAETASAALEAIAKEISEKRLALAEAESHNAKIEAAERAKARIEVLEGEQLKVGTALAACEGRIFLIEEFIRARVKLLTERINARFNKCKWKLFAEQINGGLTECCEVTVNGIPYQSLNHGAGGKVEAGLEVINVLAHHFEFAPPILIDGAESLTEAIPTLGQQIRLTARKGDATLRVEIDGVEIEVQNRLSPPTPGREVHVLNAAGEDTLRIDTARQPEPVK